MKLDTAEERKTVQHHTSFVLLLRVKQTLVICGVTFVKNTADTKTMMHEVKTLWKHYSI
jgi:hypothetical protein